MRKKSPTAARKQFRFSLLIEEEGWRKHRTALSLIRRAVKLALDQPPVRSGGFTLLLSDDLRLRQLNRQFRGKDKPTNVLAFQSRDPSHLGDVAIALRTVEREARAQNKTVPAHAAHLAVHGLLHLKGYDHGTAAERNHMETVESLILSRLGVPNPYITRPYTRTAKAVN